MGRPSSGPGRPRCGPGRITSSSGAQAWPRWGRRRDPQLAAGLTAGDGPPAPGLLPLLLLEGLKLTSASGSGFPAGGGREALRISAAPGPALRDPSPYPAPSPPPLSPAGLRLQLTLGAGIPRYEAARLAQAGSLSASWGSRGPPDGRQLPGLRGKRVCWGRECGSRRRPRGELRAPRAWNAGPKGSPRARHAGPPREWELGRGHQWKLTVAREMDWPRLGPGQGSSNYECAECHARWRWDGERGRWVREGQSRKSEQRAGCGA